MNTIEHGISVGIERVESVFFLSLKAVGKLTHADYEKITPMIDSALAEVDYPKIKALIDFSELDGWELRAVWDDFKIGLMHGSEFDKVAMFGSKRWQELAAKVGSWFISGEVKYFDNFEDAFNWLEE